MEYNPLNLLATAAALQSLEKTVTEEETMSPQKCSTEDTVDKQLEKGHPVARKLDNGVRKVSLTVNSDLEKMFDEHNYGNAKKSSKQLNTACDSGLNWDKKPGVQQISDNVKNWGKVEKQAYTGDKQCCTHEDKCADDNSVLSAGTRTSSEARSLKTIRDCQDDRGQVLTTCPEECSAIGELERKPCPSCDSDDHSNENISPTANSICEPNCAGSKRGSNNSHLDKQFTAEKMIIKEDLFGLNTQSGDGTHVRVFSSPVSPPTTTLQQPQTLIINITREGDTLSSHVEHSQADSRHDPSTGTAQPRPIIRSLLTADSSVTDFREGYAAEGSVENDDENSSFTVSSAVDTVGTEPNCFDQNEKLHSGLHEEVNLMDSGDDKDIHVSLSSQPYCLKQKCIETENGNDTNTVETEFSEIKSPSCSLRTDGCQESDTLSFEKEPVTTPLSSEEKFVPFYKNNSACPGSVSSGNEEDTNEDSGMQNDTDDQTLQDSRLASSNVQQLCDEKLNLLSEDKHDEILAFEEATRRASQCSVISDHCYAGCPGQLLSGVHSSRGEYHTDAEDGGYDSEVSSCSFSEMSQDSLQSSSGSSHTQPSTSYDQSNNKQCRATLPPSVTSPCMEDTFSSGVSLYPPSEMIQEKSAFRTPSYSDEPITPTKTFPHSPVSHTSPKVGKYRIGMFASFSNSSIGIENENQSPVPFWLQKTNTKGGLHAGISSIGQSDSSVLDSSSATAVEKSVDSLLNHIVHDHDYCIQSTLPNVLTDFPGEDNRADTPVKSLGSVKYKKQVSDGGKSARKKQKKINLQKPQIAILNDLENEESEDDGVMNPNSPSAVGSRLRKKNDVMLASKLSSSDSKLKITGKFQDQYVYYLNTKPRNRRRPSSGVTVPTDKILLPVPKPGDIVVPHLTDADIEALKLKAPTKGIQSVLLSQNLKDSSTITQPENISDEENKIINTILSLENGDIPPVAMEETLVLQDGGGLVDNFSFNPEQMNLTDEQMKILYSAMEEVQSLSPDLGDSSKMTLPSFTSSSASQLSPSVAMESTVSSSSVPVTPTEIGPGNPMSPTGRLSHGGSSSGSLMSLQSESTVSTQSESPDDTLVDGVTTDLTAADNELKFGAEGTSVASVDIEGQVSISVKPTDEDADKEASNGSDLPPAAVRKESETPGLFDLDNTLPMASMVFDNTSRSVSKADVDVDSSIKKSESNKIINDKPLLEVAGESGSNSPVKALPQTSQNDVNLPVPDLSFPTLDKSLDFLGFKLDRTELFTEQPTAVNNSVHSDTGSLPAAPEINAPWIVTVSMYWNDLPAIMLENLPFVRLVDIHKQILPAKDTGILKKRCQLLGLEVKNCSEMQRYFLVQYGRAYNSKSTLIVSKDNAKILIGYYVDPSPKTHRFDESRIHGVAKRPVLKFPAKPQEPTATAEPAAETASNSLPEATESYQKKSGLVSTKQLISSSPAVPCVSSVTPEPRLSQRTRHKKINFLELLKGESPVVEDSTVTGDSEDMSTNKTEEKESAKISVKPPKKSRSNSADKPDLGKKMLKVGQSTSANSAAEKDKTDTGSKKMGKPEPSANGNERKRKHKLDDDSSSGVSSEEWEEDCSSEQSLSETSSPMAKKQKRCSKDSSKNKTAVAKNRIKGKREKLTVKLKGVRQYQRIKSELNIQNKNREGVLEIAHKDLNQRNGHKDHIQNGDVFLNLYESKSAACVKCCSCSKLLSVDAFLTHLHDQTNSLKLVPVTQPQTIFRRTELSDFNQKLWDRFQRKKELFDNNQLTPSPEVVSLDSPLQQDMIDGNSSGEQIVSPAVRKGRVCTGTMRKYSPVVRIGTRKRKQKQLYPIENYSYSKRKHALKSDGNINIDLSSESMSSLKVNTGEEIITPLAPDSVKNDLLEQSGPSENDNDREVSESVVTLKNFPEVTTYTALQDIDM